MRCLRPRRRRDSLKRKARTECRALPCVDQAAGLRREGTAPPVEISSLENCPSRLKFCTLIKPSVRAALGSRPRSRSGGGLPSARKWCVLRKEGRIESQTSNAMSPPPAKAGQLEAEGAHGVPRPTLVGQVAGLRREDTAPPVLQKVGGRFRLFIFPTGNIGPLE